MVDSLSGYEPYGALFVDGMNLLSRSFYGMPTLEYKGRKTGMLYGAARLVVEWSRRNAGIKIVFVWEGKDSWRRAKYPIYKAHRKQSRDPDASEEFYRQVQGVQESLSVMGVDQVSAYTYEADDTVWSAMSGVSGKLVFASNDWDWWPLIQHGEILYGDGLLFRTDLEKKFAKKFKCDPIPMERMWMFKVLTGDPSDNVSGIPRIPRKIAAEISSDLSVDEESIVDGLIRHGFPTWADRAENNKWILDRNLDLIRTAPPPIDALEWVDAAYNLDEFGEVLWNSGMGDLYYKIMRGKGDGGKRDTD